MREIEKIKHTLILLVIAILPSSGRANDLKVNVRGYFERRGLNVFVFSNVYGGNFNDAKMSGIEIIHHGVRTATNGDVRLSPTPEQWDPIPRLVKRTVHQEENRIETRLVYPDHHFEYTLTVESHDGGLLLGVYLREPLPRELEGRAGFNLEFLPSAYYEKAYLIDGKNGIFPLYPGGPMEKTGSGRAEPKPIAIGKTLVLAPEDPARHVTIQATEGDLALYDGRNQAQNGWYVVRTLIPPGKTGRIIEWYLTATTISNWTRPPVIAHSQVGYHPHQKKIAVIELDKNDTALKSARLLKVTETGAFIEKKQGHITDWGEYLRYRYAQFEFSSVKESGLYIIEYNTVHTKPFRIATDVFEKTWHPTMDVFFPVQMDHMTVNEAYRVWHGACHLDDALQAPVNHEHFDLYAQGSTTDTPFDPGEHIPGLNTGGWFDAGDYDIRTQTHYHVVLNLVQAWEAFRPMRDETTVDQKNRYVDIHHPDGVPDLLQQIEHGALALIAQHRAVGHAIPGIIVPQLSQYTHLGDASTMTDNLIYNPNLTPHESDGLTSGRFDDRWAFTSKSTPLNYGSIAALAAAGRALQAYNDDLAEECLATARRVWDEEHAQEPDIFRHGNTTGGSLEAEEIKAAVELLISTQDEKYGNRLRELLPEVEDRFSLHASFLIRALPFMDAAYAEKMESLVMNYGNYLNNLCKQNPFGVPISMGSWAGAGLVVSFAMTNTVLYSAFPEHIDPETIYRGLHYIYGCHPGSDVSFVSGVGTASKRVAYGTNRADYAFIAGGIVPGVLILKPDFPENKEDWPFLWGENEYVINLASSYIYLVNAVHALLSKNEG